MLKMSLVKLICYMHKVTINARRDSVERVYEFLLALRRNCTQYNAIYCKEFVSSAPCQYR